VTAFCFLPGKTTVLKILAGAHDATSGLALVAGYDVSCERISVFERLGNCPQFDVIWPKLSVRQHLVFFAKLKGLRRDQVEVAALDIASAVGLGTSEVYNRNAGDLSGGMRRRLSIAISLIGAPSVFVLDEPTTGLDPSTRNSIWGLVNSFATEDRAIIITTHMMIEADTLCNRIAIVARGELVVVGTQQHLKDRFGSGYLLQLNLVKSTPENQETAMAFVHEHLHKDATLGIKQAKTLHISLPRELDLQRVFAALYNPDLRPSCINQFLLSQSSLEDVFLALGD
jgi:ABC-type multidrug transport system ATPase subunit